MSLMFLILIFIGLHCFHFVSGQAPMVSFLITVPSESLNKVIFEGDVAVMKCTVLELPRNAVNVGISVRHNGRTVPSIMESEQSASVTFLSVSNLDKGQYECIVSYTIQPGVIMTLPTKTLSLMVYSPSSSPVCVHDKSLTTVHVGDEVQLSCYFKFNSDATPIYQWQRLGDESSVLTSTVNNLAGNTGVLQTVIGPLQMENSILFLCFNTMDVGNSRCTVQITVQSMIPTTKPTEGTASPKEVNDTSTIASMKTVTSLAGTGSSQTSNVLLYVGILIVLLLICVVVAVIVMYMFRSKREVENSKPHRDNTDHVYDNPVMQNLSSVESYNQPVTHWTLQNGGSPEPVEFVDNRNNVSIKKDDIIVAFTPNSNERISPEGTKDASGTHGEQIANEGAPCNTNTSPESGAEIYNIIDEMYVDMSDSLRRGMLASDFSNDLSKDLIGSGKNEDDTTKYETFPCKPKEEPSGERRNTYMIYEGNNETSKNNQGKEVCADKVEYTDMGNFQRESCDETSGSQKVEDDDIAVTSIPKTAEDFGHLYTVVNKTRRKLADNHIEAPRVDPVALSGNDVSTDDIQITGNRVSTAADEDFSYLYSAVNKNTGKGVNSKNEIGASVSEVGFAHPRFIEISPSNSEDGLEDDFSHLYTAIDKTKHTKPELSDASNKDTKGQDFSELYSQVEKKPHKSK